MKKYLFSPLIVFLLSTAIFALPGMSTKTHTNYTQGFDFGVTIRNLPMVNSYSGNVYWVDSNLGVSGNPGTFKRPIDSIDNAMGLCTANKGDIIMVKAGHTESVVAASGIDCDIAGVTVVGYGNGTNRPTITLGTLVTADVDIDAANVSLFNLRFIAGLDTLANIIDINAANASVVNCEFLASATIQATLNIDIATAADNTYIGGNTFLSETAGADAAINISGTPNSVIIEDNFIYGDFANAGIQSSAAFTVSTVRDNIVANTQTGDHAVQFSGASTGFIIDNSLYGDTAGAILDPGSMFSLENYSSTGNVYSGILDPIVAP